MKALFFGTCLLALIPISACSGPKPEPNSQSMPPADARDAAAHPAAPCGIRPHPSDYQAISDLGSDFSGSYFEIFKLKRGDETLYASKPEKLDHQPDIWPLTLAYAWNASDELELKLCLYDPGSSASIYGGPIGSQGGAPPVVAEVLLADVDSDPGDELIVLVAWKVENELGTSGTFFEPYIFSLESNSGAMERVELEDSEALFGFEGVREGEEVTYPYKDTNALRSRLTGHRQ